MEFASLARRGAMVLGATAVLFISGSLAWAAANDYVQREVVPAGVSVTGVDISGMTAGEARAVIRENVAEPLQRKIIVRADGKTFEFDPAGTVSVDTEAMIAEALSPRRSAPLVTRVRTDLGHTVLSADVQPLYTVDEAKLAAFVSTVKSSVERKPVNAKIDVVDGKLVLQKSATGRVLNAEDAEKSMIAAFSPASALGGAGTGVRDVTLAVTRTKPKVTEDQLGKTIIVDRSDKSLKLYDGMELEKSYRCAVGTLEYPTPLGKWKVVNKQYMPAWYNPGSDWAKGMPKVIPPGPGNPLGTRALALDASGVLIHGTSKDYSIGTAASHGCMRMHMWDVEDLFPRVPVGTPVYIMP